MKAQWKIETVSGGYRLTLVGANGEEVLRAMTIYNNKLDALHAIGLAQAADEVLEDFR